jgi:phosphate starvation-inducible PhoH-like protein
LLVVLRKALLPDGETTRVELEIDGIAMVRLLGPHDRFLSTLESKFPAVVVNVRGNIVTLEGVENEVHNAQQLFTELIDMIANGADLSDSDVVQGESIVREGGSVSDVLGEAIVSSRGRTVRPKTAGQKTYVDAIEHNTIVFGIGPAGTGKTYLAMAKAVQALHRKDVTRIILTRPAVEAGEKLGFLPGTLTDKIDPYLRPLYDALNDMVDPELVPKLLATGVVEVAPLAYMRGRTLNDSFIILDEAQNTTPEQMKMFLTRLGFGSKMIVTGDITQVDLPANVSGLKLATQILGDMDDVQISTLTSADVVRHTLVAKIVDAYTLHEQKAQAAAAQRKADKR